MPNAIDLHGLQAFFVHGHLSDSEVWQNDGPGDKNDFTPQLMALLRFADNLTYDTHFSWAKHAGPLDTYDFAEREAAGLELAQYVIDNRNFDENITLIGVSHGGNIAIIAASYLSDLLGMSVDVITLNTPANNNEDSRENPNSSSGINQMIQITTADDPIVGRANLVIGRVGEKTYARTYKNKPKTHKRYKYKIKNSFTGRDKHSTANANPEKLFEFRFSHI